MTQGELSLLCRLLEDYETLKEHYDQKRTWDGYSPWDDEGLIAEALALIWARKNEPKE